MTFKSNKYPNLGFYANGHFREFYKGVYSTEDKKEIEILKSMNDVEIKVESNSNSEGAGKK